MGKDVAKELKNLRKSWEETEPATGGSNVPLADYVAKLAGIELGFSKAGNLQAVITFKIYDGKYKGKEVKSFQGLSTDVGISFFKGFCEVVGLEYPEDPTELPEAIDSFMGDFDELVNIAVVEKDGYVNVRVKGLSELSDDDGDADGGSSETKEEEKEEITADDINKMKRKALLSLIEENGLDTDPDDHDETDDLKAAIIDELGLSEKKKDKKKNKK